MGTVRHLMCSAQAEPRRQNPERDGNDWKIWDKRGKKEITTVRR